MTHQPVIVFPVACTGVDRDGFCERVAHIHAAFEAERGREQGINLLMAECHAPRFREMSRNRRLQPGPAQCAGNHHIGSQLLKFGEKLVELTPALGRRLLERVYLRGLPLQPRGHQRRKCLVTGANDEGVSGVGPSGNELGER